MSKKKSGTEQLNLRMPKELLEDIDTIAKILRVNKSEWIKIKLSEIVYEEKKRLKEENKG
jgi:metal-responsive CopG/Arc/MetJ family transcriptional regulator